MSEQLAPMSASSIGYGSLSCSHTNAFLVAVNAGCPTMDPTLAVEGCLSKTSISNKDERFAEALSGGLRWLVVRREVPAMYPTLCELIQHAKHATATVSRRESEIQVPLRIQEMMVGEMGPPDARRPVGWELLYSKIVQRVIAAEVGDVQALCSL